MPSRVLTVLLLALTGLAPAAFGQNDSLQQDVPTVHEIRPVGEHPAVELSAYRKFERTIDEAAGKVVGWMSAVLFWEAIGHQDDAAEATVTTVDEATVGRMIEEIRGRGKISLKDASLTLTIPGDPQDQAQSRSAETLGTVLTRRFGDKEQEIKVVLDPGKKVTDPIRLEALRSGFPIIVIWLLVGALFLTLYMKFVNFRAFKHAIFVTKGHFDDPSEAGEVTHFQALASALSATVGLGNIAGVAIAISIGGAGATFWLIVAGLLGMTSKFTECTLGQMYRKIDDEGRVSGGAFEYLSQGLKERGLGGLGRVLAVLFAVLCIGGSFGGGNMFQVKQSLGGVQQTFPFLQDSPWVYGMIMVVLTGIVIIGGIKRIAKTADKIVPFMCGTYVLFSLFILIKHAADIPSAFGHIIGGAFTPAAGLGGIVGVLVQGIRRAVFSNEAGVGSAAIAHSAAKTEEPVREGIVALLEPFIDTVVICTMTALVMVVTDAFENPSPDFHAARAAGNGAQLTSLAFKAEISWFPYVLSLIVFLFAYSTMISWSYYGERCTVWLFGPKASLPYKLIFLCFVFMGSIISAGNILDFSDLMILGMSLPNIIGLYILSPKVRAALDEYMGKLGRGEFKIYK